MPVKVKRSEGKVSATFSLPCSVVDFIAIQSVLDKCKKSDVVEHCIRLFEQYEERCKMDSGFEEYCNFKF